MALPAFWEDVLSTNSFQPLHSVPSAGRMLDEPVLLVGQALTRAVADRHLPDEFLESKEAIAGAASQALEQAKAAVAPGTFSGCSYLHRHQPGQLSLQLAIAATVDAQAQAARLIRQGSITVDLGEGGRPCPLVIPVAARHVLAAPFDTTLVFSQFPSSFACVGVTAVLLEAAGIPVTTNPDDLTGAYVVAELAGEPLGPGGTCLASEPDTSRVVAHVRAPAADPHLKQLPRGFQVFGATTRIQVKSLYEPPAAPQESAALEAALRDLQARVVALEAGRAPSPAQHSGRAGPAGMGAPPVYEQDITMAAAEEGGLTPAAAAQVASPATPAAESPDAALRGAGDLPRTPAQGGSPGPGQPDGPRGGPQDVPMHAAGVAVLAAESGPLHGPGAPPTPVAAAGSLAAQVTGALPSISMAATATGTAEGPPPATQLELVPALARAAAPPQPCRTSSQPGPRAGADSGAGAGGNAPSSSTRRAAARPHLPLGPSGAGAPGGEQYPAVGAGALHPSAVPALGRARRLSVADLSPWWRHPAPSPGPAPRTSPQSPQQPPPPPRPHAAAALPHAGAALDTMLTQVQARSDLLGSVTPRAGVGFPASHRPSPAEPGTPRPPDSHPAASPPDAGSRPPPPDVTVGGERQHARSRRLSPAAAAARPASPRLPPSGPATPSQQRAAGRTGVAAAPPAAGPPDDQPLPPAHTPPTAGGPSTLPPAQGTASSPAPPAPRGVKRSLPTDIPEQTPRPCPAVRVELGPQHLDRLVEAVADARAGREQPRHRAQHEPGLRALRAGYRDALMDELQVAPGPLQVVVNGQSAVETPSFHPHPLAASAAPRAVLLAIFGSLTAALPPPEEVDPRPVAEAFWKGAREQYDRHLAPAPRQRQQRAATPRTVRAPTRGRVFPPPIDTSPAAKRKAARRRRARNQQAGAGGVPQ